MESLNINYLNNWQYKIDYHGLMYKHITYSNALCLLHIIWLANELLNSQVIHRYPCEFSEDIVTLGRQRFRAINTGVFNVHNLDTRP